MNTARFFASPEAFREWLDANHATEQEVIVGFYRKATGKPTMSWSHSVDEALCYGWIDGVRRSIDAERYTIRFTPRKPRSIWSRVNLAKVEKLIHEGRMMPAGLAAWMRRDPARSGIYSFERNPAEFEPEQQRAFARHRKALKFFEQQPPSYRKVAKHWVTSAKRPDTRARRLADLIEHSSRGLRLPQFVSSRRS